MGCRNALLRDNYRDYYSSVFIYNIYVKSNKGIDFNIGSICQSLQKEIAETLERL